MVKEYELHTALERAAKDMHDFDANPSTWLKWITYLLKQMESQAMDVDPANQQRYREMLSTLRDTIYTRLQTGGW